MFISKTEKAAIGNNLHEHNREIMHLTTALDLLTRRFNALEAKLPKAQPPKVTSNEKKMQQAEYSRKYYAAKKLAGVAKPAKPIPLGNIDFEL